MRNLICILLVLVEDVFMFKEYRFVAAVLVTLALTGPVAAYGTQPDDTVKKDRQEGAQMADACLPRLSPQMAAAYGLPLTPPGEARNCRAD